MLKTIEAPRRRIFGPRIPAFGAEPVEGTEMSISKLFIFKNTISEISALIYLSITLIGYTTFPALLLTVKNLSLCAQYNNLNLTPNFPERNYAPAYEYVFVITDNTGAWISI